MQMHCYCRAGSKWLQQSPETHNAFRVECPRCKKFAKWGNQDELDRITAAGEIVEVVSYRAKPAGPTLDRFMSDE
jgi:hypothetical protein